MKTYEVSERTYKIHGFFMHFLLAITLCCFGIKLFHPRGLFQFAIPMSTGANAGSAPTGITYVGTCDNSGSAITSIACTYASVPAGATIAIGVSGSSGATGVADSINGAATQVGTNLTYNSGGAVANIWYVKNASAGSHTVTATFASASNFTRFKIMVFSGASLTAPLDTSAVGSGATGATATTANFTTATANEMVAGFIWGQGGPLPNSAPAPYTLLIASTASAASEYGIQTTAGTYTASAGLSASGQWGIMAMALKQ